MEHLNLHMQNTHNESDHDRIIRLTETYQAKVESTPVHNKKSFDCSECGEIDQNSDELKNHNEQIHIKSEPLTPKRKEKEIGEVEIKEDKEYKMRSWEGANGETAGYVLDGGKNVAFSQTAVEIKKLFNSNREHDIGNFKFTQEKKKTIPGGT